MFYLSNNFLFYGNTFWTMEGAFNFTGKGVVYFDMGQQQLVVVVEERGTEHIVLVHEP